MLYSRDCSEHIHAPELLNVRAKALPMLMEWLVDVQLELELNERVLYLARNYMDRYFSRCDVTVRQLQLVAAAALLVAAKLEEDEGAAADEVNSMCDGAYSTAELIVMERQLLTVLDYKTLAVTELDFLDRYVAAVMRRSTYSQHKLFMLCSLSHYLLELYLLSPSLNDYPSSVTAAAALLLAAAQLTLRVWSEQLESECRMRRQHPQLRHCMALIYSMYRHYCQCPNTISQKYSLKQHGCVSLLAPCPEVQ